MIDIAASHRQRLGCSMIAQALGVSAHRTPYQLWEVYTGREPWPELGDDRRVALGEPMENVLRPFVEKKLGGKLRRDTKEYFHPRLSLVAHVDFRLSTLAQMLMDLGITTDQRPVVDMKTSLGFGAKFRFGADGSDEVDSDVLLQMQGYTLLTGADLALVAALVPGPEIKIYPIRADPELHRMIEEGVEKFWWHVTTDTPPDITTLEDAIRRWPNSIPNSLSADDQTLLSIAALREVKAVLAEQKKIADQYELEIKRYMADAEALLDESGKPLCTWKSQGDRRVFRVKKEKAQ